MLRPASVSPPCGRLIRRTSASRVPTHFGRLIFHYLIFRPFRMAHFCRQRNVPVRQCSSLRLFIPILHLDSPLWSSSLRSLLIPNRHSACLRHFDSQFEFAAKNPPFESARIRSNPFECAQSDHYLRCDPLQNDLQSKSDSNYTL